MKKLITVLFLFALAAPSLAQNSPGNDTSKYVWYKYNYGTRQPRFQADSVANIPNDTTYSKSGIAKIDTTLYVGNGIYWMAVGSNFTNGTITSGIDSATFVDGTLCFWTLGASQCYDLSRYFCQSGYNYDTTKMLFYNCDGDLVDSLRFPFSYVDVIYPVTKSTIGDTTYIGVDVLNGQNGLLLGGRVSHDTLYTYDVTSAIYSINGVTYTSNSGNVTLDPSDDDFDRQDIIALDTNGNIVSITGTPGADPQLPQVDPLSQVFLTSVYVKALSTGPDDINKETIYDENVENWTRTVSGGITANADNATNVFHLLKSLDVSSWATTQSILFTRSAGVIPAGTYSILKMFINLKAPLSSTANIQIRFFNVGSTPVGSAVLSATHGFIKTDAGIYQNVTVPIPAGPITRVQIVFSGVAGGAYFDYIQLQGGITTGTSPYITDVFRKSATDSVFKVVNGVSSFAFKDSTGGGASTLQQIFNNEPGGSVLTRQDTITAGANTLKMLFNGITSNAGLSIESNSTAAASQTQRLLNVSLTGANATGQDTYSAFFQNNHTDANGGFNYGIYSSAGGADVNIAIKGQADGSGGIGVAGQSSTGSAIYGLTSTGFGVNATATSGTAVQGLATSGTGVSGQSQSVNGIGVDAGASDGLAGRFFAGSPANNTVIPVIEIDRSPYAPASLGIGASIDYRIATSDVFSLPIPLSNQLVSKWTDVTGATRTSAFTITGVSNAATADLLTISGNGAARLHNYGAGTFTGTPVYSLSTDANGNIIETSVGSSITKVYQEIISTGGQTTFSFTTVPTTSAGYMVYVNGAAIPKTYYSVSTNDIIFSAGLVNGDSVVIQGVQ